MEEETNLGVGWSDRKGSVGWGDRSVFGSIFKHEGLSSNPRTHIKMLAVVPCACHPRVSEAEMKGSLGLADQSA